MEGDPDERTRQTRRPSGSVGRRALVYFGFREAGGAPERPGPRSWRWMVGYSLLWGFLFPLLDGHRRSYLVAVIVATTIMFVVQVLSYGISAWLRRRSA